MSGPAAPSGPLRLWVGELLARPGRRQHFDGTESLAGLGARGGGITGERVEVALVLECQAGRIMVSGRVAACWELECRRCLEPVQVPVAVGLTEVFEVAPTDGETFPLEGEQVDLAPMLAQAVLLTLPLAPLCDESCRGPAGGTHFGLPDDPDPDGDADPDSDPDNDPDDPEGGAGEGGRPRRDPRWAALDGFTGAIDGGT